MRFNIVPDDDGPSGESLSAIIAFLLLVTGVAGVLKLLGVW